METPPPPPPVTYKDRKAGLIVFGVLTLLGGCLCALLVPLTIFAQMVAPHEGPQLNHQAMIPGVVLYAAMAIALIWLGIGSIQARRWARALLLIGSWSALGMGIVSLASAS